MRTLLFVLCVRAIGDSRTCTIIAFLCVATVAFFASQARTKGVLAHALHVMVNTNVHDRTHNLPARMSRRQASKVHGLLEQRKSTSSALSPINTACSAQPSREGPSSHTVLQTSPPERNVTKPPGLVLTSVSPPTQLALQEATKEATPPASNCIQSAIPASTGIVQPSLKAKMADDAVSAVTDASSECTTALCIPDTVAADDAMTHHSESPQRESELAVTGNGVAQTVQPREPKSVPDGVSAARACEPQLNTPRGKRKEMTEFITNGSGSEPVEREGRGSGTGERGSTTAVTHVPPWTKRRRTVDGDGKLCSC